MEGKHLFLKLAEYGVRVNLNDSDWQKAEEITHLFIKRFPDESVQKSIIFGIARVTRNRLRPKVIDEELIRKYIENTKKRKKPEFERMSGDEEEEEEETLLEEGEEEPTEEDRKVWLVLCRRQGFRTKRGEDVKMLRLMIPFLAQCSGLYPLKGSARRGCIRIFMYLFLRYIDMYCLRDLNDVGMLLHVIEALKSSRANPENKLKQNIVPTKEEGISAPMYLLKLEEKRERGDMELDESRERKKICSCFTQP
ncbi:hypothetical protein ABKV19_008380 [Rosa sericea]